MSNWAKKFETSIKELERIQKRVETYHRETSVFNKHLDRLSDENFEKPGKEDEYEMYTTLSIGASATENSLGKLEYDIIQLIEKFKDLKMTCEDDDEVDFDDDDFELHRQLPECPYCGNDDLIY